MTEDTILDEFAEQNERRLEGADGSRKRHSARLLRASKRFANDAAARGRGQQSISRRLGSYKRPPVSLAKINT